MVIERRATRGRSRRDRVQARCQSSMTALRGLRRESAQNAIALGDSIRRRCRWSELRQRCDHSTAGAAPGSAMSPIGVRRGTARSSG